MPKLQQKLQTAQVLGFSDGRDNRAGVLHFFCLCQEATLQATKVVSRKLQTLSLLKDLLMSFL